MVVENLHRRFDLEVGPGAVRGKGKFAYVDRAGVPQAVHNPAGLSLMAVASSRSAPNQDQPECNDAGWGTADGVELGVQELVVLVDSSGWVFVP